METNQLPMAWEEPGNNNKGKDPWGRNNKNDGPPDLDEVFKNLQDKLGKMFGGGGSGGSSFGGSTGSSGGGFVVGLTLILAVIAYLIAGFYIVKPAEQGVVTRFGKYNRVVTEGPHWYPRFIEDVQVINIEKLNSSRHRGWMLTKDENIIHVEMDVQYRISDPVKYLFSVSNADRALKQAADSSLRQAVGNSTLEGDNDIMTSGKQQVSQDIQLNLIELLNSYDIGLFIDKVNFHDPRPPEPVEDAFNDATKSREDRERFTLEAQAYEKKIIPEAEGLAQQKLAEAEAYKQEVILAAQGNTQKFDLVLPEYNKAPKVTKTRMYLDTVEEVLSNTSKVLVDLDKGNNLVYLPIDKLMDNAKSSKLSRQVNNSKKVADIAYDKKDNQANNSYQYQDSDASQGKSRRRRS